MLIALPPSEGKATEGTGPALRLDGLGHPGLNRTRERVLNALIKLCQGSERRALAVLGLTPGQAGAVAVNRRLREAATLPAAELYTGVLYDNLGLGTLDRAARARAADRVLIFSALWGVLRVDDAVPPYRLAMGVTLPRLGPAATRWRPVLTKELGPRSEGRLIVDLRSAPYAAAWRPGNAGVHRRPDSDISLCSGGMVAVRVVREELVDGTARRTVVSHLAKATRGAVARSLLTAGHDPATPGELVKLLAELGYAAELDGGNLTIVLSE